MSGSPGQRRAPGVRLAALAVAVLGVLGATGLPAAGAATALPDRRPSPSAAAVQAELALVQEPAPSAPLPPEARKDRVVASTQAGALFARHSWYVPPPPLPRVPPPPPAPPPVPTAPPLPYTFLGSFAPGGDPAIFFLSHGDRVIDAHVGDRLDGVYQLESAGGGQLVFIYLPLNIRQNLAAGVSR